MWIIAVLWWKRPRLAQNLILWFFGILAACAVIAAPARLYLRFAGAPVPHDAPIVWDGVGLLAGPLVLAAVLIIVWERKRRADR